MAQRTDGRPIIWVTGANGFLGRYIVRAFEQARWTVIGTKRSNGALGEDRGEELFPASFTPSGLRALLDQTGPPAAVFHAAGSGTVGETVLDPRRGLSDTVGTAFEMIQFLIEHCPESAFIYPSSCSVYGDRPRGPIPEDAPLRPASPYGAYKAAVELLCCSAALNAGLRAGVVRYFSVYGPGQRKQLLWDLCQKAIHARGSVELFGTGSETRDFLHAEDAARLSVLVAHDVMKLEPGMAPLVVNGGSEASRTVREVADAVVGALPVELDIVFNGKSRPGDPNHFEASVARSSALGFTPRWTFEEGIEDYCRWFTAACLEEEQRLDSK